MVAQATDNACTFCAIGETAAGAGATRSLPAEGVSLLQANGPRPGRRSSISTSTWSRAGRAIVP